MRAGLVLLILVALGASFAVGSSAFNAGQATRSIGVAIAADSAGYLALAANDASPHRCFVDVENGRTSITFDAPSTGCGAGAGTGLNAGDGSTTTRYSRYAFHDLLLVTNKGTSPVFLWVNATTSSSGSSQLDAALTTASGQMSDSAYSTAEGPVTLAIGSSAYLGARVNAGTLATGSVTGTLRLEARE